MMNSNYTLSHIIPEIKIEILVPVDQTTESYIKSYNESYNAAPFVCLKPVTLDIALVCAPNGQSP
jgi:hypothetical protein